MSIFNKLDRDKKTVTGVGSALVDILAREADVFLEKVGAVKGGMQYVDDAVIDQTVRMLASPPFVVPGGSACNTVMGVARL
ncbi:MAG: adenosine kinase, partial [Desulfatitalea sp.]|nr:adenosine kinase [Desulfatitalea sp.]NNK00855.1 adenosine kinase [Desulfatitalea sp.]